MERILKELTPPNNQSTSFDNEMNETQSNPNKTAHRPRPSILRCFDPCYQSPARASTTNNENLIPISCKQQYEELMDVSYQYSDDDTYHEAMDISQQMEDFPNTVYDFAMQIINEIVESVGNYSSIYEENVSLKKGINFVDATELPRNYPSEHTMKQSYFDRTLEVIPKYQEQSSKSHGFNETIDGENCQILTNDVEESQQSVDLIASNSPITSAPTKIFNEEVFKATDFNVTKIFSLNDSKSAEDNLTPAKTADEKLEQGLGEAEPSASVKHVEDQNKQSLDVIVKNSPIKATTASFDGPSTSPKNAEDSRTYELDVAKSILSEKRSDGCSASLKLTEEIELDAIVKNSSIKSITPFDKIPILPDKFDDLEELNINLDPAKSLLNEERTDNCTASLDLIEKNLVIKLTAVPFDGIPIPPKKYHNIEGLRSELGSASRTEFGPTESLLNEERNDDCLTSVKSKEEESKQSFDVIIKNSPIKSIPILSKKYDNVEGPRTELDVIKSIVSEERSDDCSTSMKLREEIELDAIVKNSSIKSITPFDKIPILPDKFDDLEELNINLDPAKSLLNEERTDNCTTSLDLIEKNLAIKLTAVPFDGIPILPKKYHNIEGLRSELGSASRTEFGSTESLLNEEKNDDCLTSVKPKEEESKQSFDVIIKNSPIKSIKILPKKYENVEGPRTELDVTKFILSEERSDDCSTSLKLREEIELDAIVKNSSIKSITPFDKIPILPDKFDDLEGLKINLDPATSLLNEKRTDNCTLSLDLIEKNLAIKLTAVPFDGIPILPKKYHNIEGLRSELDPTSRTEFDHTESLLNRERNGDCLTSVKSKEEESKQSFDVIIKNSPIKSIPILPKKYGNVEGPTIELDVTKSVFNEEKSDGCSISANSVEEENKQSLDVTVKNSLMESTARFDKMSTSSKKFNLDSSMLIEIEQLKTINEELVQNFADVKRKEEILQETIKILEQKNEELAKQNKNLLEKVEDVEASNKVKQLQNQIEELERKNGDHEKRIEELSELSKKHTDLPKKYEMFRLKEAELKNLLDDFESQFQKQHEDINNIYTDYQTAQKHLATIEMSFSDVHQKYERSKVVLEGYRTNEKVLRDALTDTQKQYQELRSHSEAQIDSYQTTLRGDRVKHENELTRLNAMLKRAEIKSSSLSTRLQQKTKECADLAKLLDEMTEN